MIARNIQIGDQGLDIKGEWSYMVRSTRRMKIDGKPAIAVEVTYRDGGNGVRYFFEDVETMLVRPKGLPSVETELPMSDWEPNELVRPLE